jgi:hypothetical protein
MCCPTKSSYRDRAPGTNVGSDLEGEVYIHLTALLYALRSFADMKSLWLLIFTMSKLYRGAVYQFRLTGAVEILHPALLSSVPFLSASLSAANA